MRSIIHCFCLLAVVSLGLCTAWSASAATPEPKCIDGSDDEISVFRLHPGDSASGPIGTQIPEIIPHPSADGTSTEHSSLKWAAVPEGVEVQSEQIGTYRGHAIFRTFFRKAAQGDDEPSAGFVRVMFSTEERTPQGFAPRPFYLANGDLISSCETTFASSVEIPFALEITENFQGHGLVWTRSVVRFDQGRPYLSAVETGGRRQPTVERHFDRTGTLLRRRSIPNH